MEHIAIEGHCYVFNANMVFDRADYPQNLARPKEIEALPEKVCRGGSSILDPYGHAVAGPVWDKEDILFADLDMTKVYASRMEFDPCGHYSRPDVLNFSFEE